MDKIRVTKEFHFEMAHALYNYDGPCRNIHGHSYILQVTVIGTPSQNPDDPKLGMVIDFGDLKRIVNKEIVKVFDHAFVVFKDAGYEPSNHQMFSNTVYVDYQPSCENLVADYAHRIHPLLPSNIQLFGLRLYETATSYAEWFASDNA